MYGRPLKDTDNDGGAVGRAGTPLEPGVAVADRDMVITALRTVHDPEIPVNIYDLGLIYDVKIMPEGTVLIEMSLTAPGCPVAGSLRMVCPPSPVI